MGMVLTKKEYALIILSSISGALAGFYLSDLYLLYLEAFGFISKVSALILALFTTTLIVSVTVSLLASLVNFSSYDDSSQPKKNQTSKKLRGKTKVKKKKR